MPGLVYIEKKHEATRSRDSPDGLRCMTVTALVAVWSEAGLSASHVQVKANGECAYTLCAGDVCQRKSTKLPPHANGAPDARLLGRLYTQPLALLAVGGMLILSLCVCTDHSLSDQVLTLIGGREHGQWILIAAVAAHLVEGSYAFYVCSKLGLSPAASAMWCVNVVITGYPILQWVLRLQKHAKPE